MVFTDKITLYLLTPNWGYLTVAIAKSVPWLQHELETQLALQSEALTLDWLSVAPPLTDELQSRCMAVLGETQRFQTDKEKGEAHEATD